jgi:hypothetical protein
MPFPLRRLTALLALPVLMAAAGRGHAQALYVAPTPVVTYAYSPPAVVAPAVSYYYTPTVSYYAVPAVSYYTPAVSYYVPTVSYFTPAVSYYAPTASVTTYRGILPWRRATVTNFYAPVVYP